MKTHIKILPLFLSIIIGILSVLHCNITVYASSHGGGGSSSSDRLSSDEWIDEEKRKEKIASNIEMLIAYGTSIVSTVTNGDFAKFVKNDEAFEEYFNPNHITYSDDVDGDGTPGIVFDGDLISYIKQALLDYAKETNGFEIVATTDAHSLPSTVFSNSYAYRTFMALVTESGCLSVSINSSSLCAARPFHTDNPVSLVLEHKYANETTVYFYDTYKWVRYGSNDGFDMRVFDTFSYSYDGNYKEFHSFDEGRDYTATKQYIFSIGASFMGQSIPNLSSYILYSIDGRKLKVFNSLNALKNYSTGQRGVYFGSGFYEDPKEIKVPFDELEKYLDKKYDSYFDDLKDLLGDKEDSMTEEEIEKIVDALIEKMGEVGDKVDNVDSTLNDVKGEISQGNSWLEKIYNRLGDMMQQISDGFQNSAVGLGNILDAIDGIVFPDNDSFDIDNIISDVTNPENIISDAVNDASMSFSDIADALTHKFPFSLPWDIYSFFSIFMDAPGSDASPAALYSDMQDGSGSAGGEARAAPYYELPLVIESFGVEEYIIVDLKELQPLSNSARAFLSVIYAVALIKLTIKFVEMMNGGSK